MTVTANSIITPQTPRAATAVATSANTSYSDTPTNTVALFSAGGSGSRITRITASARATVTATELQLFRSSDAGTTKRFFKSKLMTAYTVAQTTENVATDFGYSDDNPLVLGSGEILYAATGVGLAGGIVFCAEGADY